ncbi:ImcF-related family protein [Epibacterium ulvae]|uniref:ImcF-related family protein n=1 Tax=Epibacterium ulvae TaxID=1156985 RepID=UPI002492CEEC|nr:ImcF-related family protein [Epibacterium ulvae]
MNRLRLIKIGLLVLFLVLTLQFSFLLWHWLSGGAFQLGHFIWLGISAFVTLLAITLTLVFRKKIWVHDPQAEHAKALTHSAKAQFRQARQRAKAIDKSPNNTPWYLFLAMQKEDSATVMAELGYVVFGNPVSDKGLTFTTWTSPTAVAYRVEIEAGADLSFDLLNTVLRLLFKERPSLAVNAAYVEYELASLMQTTSVETANAATVNRILNVAVENFGIDVPVHVLLSGLNHLPDLARAALLTGHLGEDVIFGGFLPNEGADVTTRIDALFVQLIESFNAAQLQALQKQLLPEFSSALLNAPFQLALLQTQLRSRMTGLTRALPPRQKTLNLQSIVFIGARDGMAAVDPLCQVTGQRFFVNAPTLATQAEDHLNSVTMENAGLAAAAYHKEGFRVAPNRRYSFQQSLNASLWTLALAGLVGLFSLTVWAHSKAYSRINTQMEATFEAYFSSIGGVPTDSDFLVERVLKLQPLRDGLMAYEPLDQRFYHRWLPNPSMEGIYRELYHNELVNGLQTSLVSFLEKDIFAFNSVGDGVELILLASTEAQLFADQKKYKPELISYFAGGLAAEGEVSGAFQDTLRAILDDLFSLNQPPATRNEDLRAVVANTILGLDTADLLYASLMRRTDYAERLDLRQMIGPRFFEVFDPIGDPEIYLVPRGYTRVGFDQLFANGEMPELLEMIASYEAVIGETDNAVENAIIRRVAQNYTADYIARWNAFVSALRLRDAADWADAQILMQALTSPAENPVDQLVEMLASNTDIKIYLPKSVATAEEGAEAPLAEPQLASAAHSPEAATAFNIRTAFRTYLDALRADADKQSQFDLFLAYARDVNLWLDEAASATNGAGAYLFEQFKNADAKTPLAVLNAFVIRSELEIIRNFGLSIVNTLDERAMQYVYDFIDAQWQQQILATFGAGLTQSFPFNSGSDRDFPLTEFTDLFGAEGALPMFEQTYLTPFQAQSGAYVPRPTFLLTGNADLAPSAKTAFERFRRISSTLFVDGAPFLEFGLRTGFMSNGFSRLVVSSGVTLHQFRHGPIVWDEQTWPVSGVQDNDLTLRIFNRSRAVMNQTFQGPWSWFHLSQEGSVALNPSLGLAESVYDLESGTAALQFNAQQRYNPFSPGFFSGFDIPQSLFQVNALPYDTEPDEDPEEVSPSDSILDAWLRRDAEVEAMLISARGQSLSPEIRVSIQERMKAEGFYEGPIDGIIGPETRFALQNWRASQI